MCYMKHSWNFIATVMKLDYHDYVGQVWRIDIYVWYIDMMYRYDV